jgi:hypothetical protein
VNRLPAATFLVLTLLLALSWKPLESPSPSTLPRASRGSAGTGTDAGFGGDDAAHLRSPFRFAEDPSTPLPPKRPTVKPPPPTLAPPPLVQFVGFLRGPGGLEVVLSIEGEVAVGRAGETVLGYAILSVNEDLGARVRDPSGHELLLPPT